MSKLVEGFWDCKYCGTNRIRGSIHECSNCGRARDEDTVFYLDTKHISHVPEKEAIKINRNPDWLCQYCGRLNSDNDKICVSCAAPRTEENLDYFENRSKKEKEYEQKELEESKFFSDELKYSFDEPKYSSYNSTENTNHFGGNYMNEKSFSLMEFISDHIKYILITLFIILGVAGLVFLLIPKEEEITIQGMSWERCIDIEKYQTVDENDWYLPVNARLKYTREEFSHYEDVLDHYETKTREVPKERIVGYEDYVVGYRDLGNGYFEEITNSRPITETYYEKETYQEAVYR